MPALGLTAAHGQTDYSTVLLEALSLESAVLRSGATRIIVDGRNAQVPRVLVNPDADWVAEGAELPSDAGDGGQIELLPKKIGNVVAMSRESIADAPIDELDAVGRSMVRGLASKLDAKFFSVDAATATAPAGIRSLTLPGADGTVDIAGIITAIGAVAAEGGIADTVFLNTADVTALRLAAVTGGYAISDPTAPGIERVGGAQLVPTNGLAAGTAIVCQASFLIVGVRRDIAVDFSNDAMFTADSVAARVTARLDWDVSDPAATHAITAAVAV